MPTCKTLALLLLISLSGCPKQDKVPSRVPAKVSQSPLSVWNRASAPVKITVAESTQNISIPSKAARTFYLPHNLAGSRIIRVQNEWTGGVLYEGPVLHMVEPRMIVDDHGVSFAARVDRYRGRTNFAAANEKGSKP